MALKIIIPGADFSALGNPKVEDFIEGVPAAGLTALYMFDTGTLGQAYAGPAKDYSGNNFDAPLIAGSTALKTAGGVANVASGAAAANDGFAVRTPVLLTNKFTIFGVSRNLYPAAPVPTPSAYLVPWSSSGNWTNPAAPNASDSKAGNAYFDTAGRLHINQVNQASSSDTTAEIASYSTQANSNNAWAGGSTRPAISSANPKSSFMAWALAFDRDAGYTFRANGGGHTIAAANDAAIWIADQLARGATHMFGAQNYQHGPNGVRGEIAMAGIYNAVAKSAADMDALIAQMKARMLARGVTAL